MYSASCTPWSHTHTTIMHVPLRAGRHNMYVQRLSYSATSYHMFHLVLIAPYHPAHMRLKPCAMVCVAQHVHRHHIHTSIVHVPLRVGRHTMYVRRHSCSATSYTISAISIAHTYTMRGIIMPTTLACKWYCATGWLMCIPCHLQRACKRHTPTHTFVYCTMRSVYLPLLCSAYKCHCSGRTFKNPPPAPWIASRTKQWNFRRAFFRRGPTSLPLRV